jgi:pimeloyl-ACP methyl ester carboxylesterase
METLRQVMGIAQWSIISVSNGSRLALEVMRNYPQGIRSVVMDSPVPPQVNPALEWESSATSTLELFFQRCYEDEKCGQAYYDIYLPGSIIECRGIDG